MDKLAAYESLLEGHPLWEDFEKSAAWAPVGALTGVVGGAALGYAKSRELPRKSRVRGTIAGGALGGAVGMTAGGMADVTSSFRRANAALERAHAGGLLQDALDNRNHLAALRELDLSSARVDRIRGKMNSLEKEIKSLDDLDRFMTE